MFEWTVKKIVLLGCSVVIFIGTLMLILVLAGAFDNDTDKSTSNGVGPISNDTDDKNDNTTNGVDPVSNGTDNKNDNTANGVNSVDTGDDIQYKITIKSFGTDCEIYPRTLKNIVLSPVLTFTVSLDFQKNFNDYTLYNKDGDTVWTLDGDGCLRTTFYQITYYISNETYNINNYYTYNKLTLDKKLALKVDRENILKYEHDPTLKPVIVNNNIFPGGGEPYIFQTDTCQGYYLHFIKVE